MKYLVILTDGAADEPIESLGNKTPLEVAEMKNINRLAAKGIVGMAKNVPDGIPPGSDAANLSVMGYDPGVYLTGRSSLEAVSMGIDMKDTDISFRANIVTLDGEGKYEDLTMVDHAGGDITTEEADILIKDLNKALSDDEYEFFTGTSYRHCLIHKNGHTDYAMTPPHDILGKKIEKYLPKGKDVDVILDFMKKSYDILKDHPVNKKRMEKGLRPANSLWIWGQGKRPKLDNFKKKYNVDGAVISAVDLIKGIALFAEMESIDVEGATGGLNTNYDNKAKAAIDAFSRGKDYVYIHMEGPDESSHQGSLEDKLECLKRIDKKIAKPLIDYLDSTGENYKVLVLPDHRTPLHLRTHTSDPVPFVLYEKEKEEAEDVSRTYCEAVGETGPYFEQGYKLADFFLDKE